MALPDRDVQADAAVDTAHVTLQAAQPAGGRFDFCLDEFTWRPENDGQGFHNDPGDPGGATIYGVTFATFRSWRLMRNMPDPTLAQFIAAERGELRSIYRVLFWNTLQADALPPGIDLCVFDFAVLSNCIRSAEFLQRCLGIEVDGHIGPITLRAANSVIPGALMEKLTARDEAFYASLSTFRIFGHGWDRRAEDRLRLAITMTSAGAPVAMTSAGAPPDATTEKA
jgi:lysozyme family protein